MRIGELAQQAGVEASTIRYYERIGLMPPPTRTGSGYRDYGDDAAARLGYIQAAQSIGFSLGEIRETLALRDRGEAPCGHVAALIERNAEQLRQRIVRLQEMRRELLVLAEKARAGAPENHSDAAFCHIIES